MYMKGLNMLNVKQNVELCLLNLYYFAYGSCPSSAQPLCVYTVCGKFDVARFFLCEEAVEEVISPGCCHS